MHKIFFIDEDEMAKNIIKNGFTNGEFNGYEGYLVAKYYRHLGNGDTKTKRLLIEFSKKNDEYFNEVLSLDLLKRILKTSKSDWKKTSDAIFVTENELLKIRNIKNFSTQKILIVFLVYAKRNNGYVYFNQWAEIKKILGGKFTTKDIWKHLHMAYKNGLIRDSNENVFVKFMENDSKPAMKLSNDRDIWNLIKTYEKYCGGELGFCEICQEEFVRVSNFQRYCEKHRKEKELQKYKKYHKKQKSHQ